MQIKPPGKKHLKKRSSKSYHYWLDATRPKKSGRMGQLNKHAKKSRYRSELVRLSILIDDSEYSDSSFGFLVKKARSL